MCIDCLACVGLCLFYYLRLVILFLYPYFTEELTETHNLGHFTTVILFKREYARVEFRSCWLKKKKKIEISIVLGSGSESVILEHATWALPENLLETQFLSPNSDLLNQNPRNLCFWKSSKKFWCTLTFRITVVCCEDMERMNSCTLMTGK